MSSTLLTVVRVIRFGIFGLVSFFSIIVLGLGAHIAHVFAVAQVPFDSAGLGIAVSLLTLISFIPMLVLSFVDKVLWVNMVAVEVGWLGILWVLWLATAALANNDLGRIFLGACYLVGADVTCSELLGFQALAWLNWVLLFKYTIVLIALTIFQHVRGNRVWTAPVYQVDFFAPPPPGMVYEQKPGQYPPQQPQQYPPQQPQQYSPQQPQQYSPQQPQQYSLQQPQQYSPQQPQQPGQMGYPSPAPAPAPGANSGPTTTYQTPPPANPGYQA